MTTHAARLLRRAEIVLWLIGLSLLAVALAASVHRRQYQEEQKRALGNVVSEAADKGAPERMERAWALEPGTADTAGPPAPGPLLPGEELAPREEAVRAPGPNPVTESAPSSDALAPHPDPILDPDVLGRIEIPRLGLEAIVREGDDEETLDRAVGFIPGTARPGEGGNTALAGHRDTFFRPLRRIRAGDVIRFEVPPHTYEYRVEETRVVNPDEVSVLASRDAEELTLLTCYPFRWIGPAPERFVVKATRIP